MPQFYTSAQMPPQQQHPHQQIGQQMQQQQQQSQPMQDTTEQQQQQQPTKTESSNEEDPTQIDGIDREMFKTAWRKMIEGKPTSKEEKDVMAKAYMNLLAERNQLKQTGGPSSSADIDRMKEEVELLKKAHEKNEKAKQRDVNKLTDTIVQLTQGWDDEKREELKSTMMQNSLRDVAPYINEAIVACCTQISELQKQIERNDVPYAEQFDRIMNRVPNARSNQQQQQQQRSTNGGPVECGYSLSGRKRDHNHAFNPELNAPQLTKKQIAKVDPCFQGMPSDVIALFQTKPSAWTSRNSVKLARRD